MPVVVHNGFSHLVACLLKRRPVEVDVCYRCPFYIKRDGDFVYCRYEISHELKGTPVSVIAKNPVIVEADDGHIYQVAYENPRSYLEIKKIQ